MVFTTRLSGGKGGRNHLEAELRRLGIRQKNGKPNHPQTQGKVERFQQTLKKWLRAQPDQPGTVAGLQALLDAFTSTYNAKRPHRSLPHRATPATAYTARPKATPGDRTADTHDRVRADRVDADGKLTLRVGGRLHHIGIGRTHARTRVLMLVQDLHVRVINAATGELLRELVIDPARNYQPTGRPPGPPPGTPRPPRRRKTPNPDRKCRTLAGMLERLWPAAPLCLAPALSGCRAAWHPTRSGPPSTGWTTAGGPCPWGPGSSARGRGTSGRPARSGVPAALNARLRRAFIDSMAFVVQIMCGSRCRTVDGQSLGRVVLGLGAFLDGDVEAEGFELADVVVDLAVAADVVVVVVGSEVAEPC